MNVKIEVDMIGMIMKENEFPIISCELITQQVSALDYIMEDEDSKMETIK